MKRIIPILIIAIFLTNGCFAKIDYSDVSDGSWYAQAVQYVSTTGKMVGVGRGKFEPNTTVSRAMVATVLYRLDGGRKTYTHSTFDDNIKGSWYFNAIEYCAEYGIIYGYDDGLFGVDDEITRQDMMAMFYRFAGHQNKVSGKSKDILANFQDRKQVASYAKYAVNWCLEQGVVSGTSFTQVSPTEFASRAQLAKIIMNYAESILNEDLTSYRISKKNPYGIDVIGAVLYDNKISLQVSGLGALEDPQINVQYIKAEKIRISETISISKEQGRIRYVGDATSICVGGLEDVGTYRSCAVRITVLEQGKQVFKKEISLGSLLQKSPDGTPLYFKGEKEMDGRILLYHEFSKKAPEPAQNGVISTPKRFEENISTILKNGYSFVPLRHLYEYQTGNRALPQKSVILTFDDGYRSNYTMIYPILKKYNIHATIFMVTDSVNRSNRLTWDQMREMEQSGLVDMQSHSQFHQDHTTLSEKQLHNYFNTSLKEMDEELGKESIRMLAYPYGRYAENTIEIAKKYKVKIQLTTDWRALDMKNLRLDRLPRITVGYDSDMANLLSVPK